MPKRNLYSHYDLNFDKQQIFTVSQFLGVDYNPAQLQVADNHATDSLNIVFKDKVNQKRSGWEQLANIKPFEYYVLDGSEYVKKTNSTRINGVWNFIGGDKKRYVIAHIGKLLYYIENIGEGHTFLELKITPIINKVIKGSNVYDVAEELEDYKSSAFVNDRKLYIFGGTKLFVLSTNLGYPIYEAVEDHPNTYIPTTTIGVTYEDSSVNSRQGLDDVNMMTQYRRNKLVSGTYLDDGVSVRTTRFWDWSLDTSIKPKRPTDINNIKIQINRLKENA